MSPFNSFPVDSRTRSCAQGRPTCVGEYPPVAPQESTAGNLARRKRSGNLLQFDGLGSMALEVGHPFVPAGYEDKLRVNLQGPAPLLGKVQSLAGVKGNVVFVRFRLPAIVKAAPDGRKRVLPNRANSHKPTPRPAGRQKP